MDCGGIFIWRHLFRDAIKELVARYAVSIEDRAGDDMSSSWVEISDGHKVLDQEAQKAEFATCSIRPGEAGWGRFGVDLESIRNRFGVKFGFDLGLVRP